MLAIGESICIFKPAYLPHFQTGAHTNEVTTRPAAEALGKIEGKSWDEGVQP
jgi:hypothetical protein